MRRRSGRRPVAGAGASHLDSGVPAACGTLCSPPGRGAFSSEPFHWKKPSICIKWRVRWRVIRAGSSEPPFASGQPMKPEPPQGAGPCRFITRSGRDHFPSRGVRSPDFSHSGGRHANQSHRAHRAPPASPIQRAWPRSSAVWASKFRRRRWTRSIPRPCPAAPAVRSP